METFTSRFWRMTCKAALHFMIRPPRASSSSRIMIPNTLASVIETGEVIYTTFTDHSKTAGSITHRHTTTHTRWIRQYIVYTLPPNAPQAEQTTQSIIKTHISSFGACICTLLDRIDTTLSYHRIPNGITPHIYLFPLRRRHIRLSIGIHAHTSCECPSYQ